MFWFMELYSVVISEQVGLNVGLRSETALSVLA